ncbi:hypothetical protein BH23CHL5_BH23CHL5_16860 [soil metagenome]
MLRFEIPSHLINCYVVLLRVLSVPGLFESIGVDCVSSAPRKKTERSVVRPSVAVGETRLSESNVNSSDLIQISSHTIRTVHLRGRSD